MHPIWRDIDSVALKPAAEQLERERREGLHQHRFHLSSRLIRPYAICETPAFLLASATDRGDQGVNQDREGSD
jgi:hypothetical protein